MSANRFNNFLDIVTRNDTVKGKRALKRRLVEMIQRGEVEPEDALLSITTKMSSTNPLVVILSIDILDSWVMSCGRLIQDEVVKEINMEKLKEMLKNTSNMEIKEEILYLINDWAETLESHFIRETVELLKAEGYEFPVLDTVSTGMEEFPQDSNSCQRCLVTILTWEDKSNCEICEKSFCMMCLIKKFCGQGIVNLVCQDCEQLIGNQAESTSVLFRNKSWDSNQPDYLLEDDEEEELHLAMALSKSEQVKDQMRASSSHADDKYTPSQCSICYEERVDSILYPCSHLCMCFKCASEQWEGVGNGCCPLCRIPIEHVTHL